MMSYAVAGSAAVLASELACTRGMHDYDGSCARFCPARWAAKWLSLSIGSVDSLTGCAIDLVVEFFDQLGNFLSDPTGTWVWEDIHDCPIDGRLERQGA
jgi:hypothetical protein